MNIRKLSLKLLNEYEAGSKYANLALSSHSTSALTADERAALTALFYTTVEHKLEFDYYISALSGRSIDSIDFYTRNILRLGLCQILKMTKIPDFAAVNESVKLARSQGERSFVNGVLRAAARSKDNMPLPDGNKNYKRYLAVKYSFPLSTVKLLDSVFGSLETEKLLEYFNNEKYTDLFVNTAKTTVEDFICRLSQRGIIAHRDSDVPNSVRIEGSVNPEMLCGFAEGEFFVQDKACALSALALAPKSEEKIIDVCACPGGKSFAAAVLTGDKSEILAFDIHESKLPLVDSGAERLGLKSIRAEQRDATEPDESLFGFADKVICDVPCSGLGVLGKKPDLRYKDNETLESLPEIQYSILESSAKYLKVGGELLYSTCTLNPVENSEVVQRFLLENADYALVDFEIGKYKAINGELTLVPHIDNCDGFYMAKIKRVR